MRRLCIAGVVALLLTVGLAGDTRQTGVVEAHPVEGVDVPALIDEASAYWGVNAVQMRRISWCESRWFPGAYNRSGASGLFQFMPRTWNYASRMAGYAGWSPFNAEANAYSAAWLMRAEGPRHWSCR